MDVLDKDQLGRVPAELVVKFKAATTASKAHSTPRSPGNGITHMPR
jgi:hypothetical protein